MAYSRYATELKDKDNNVYGLMDEEAREAQAQGEKLLHEEMSVGTSEEVPGKVISMDSDPYTFRRTGRGKAVGSRSRNEKIVGGTVAWNQLVQNGNFANTNNWTSMNNATVSASNNVLTVTPVASGLQVRHDSIRIIQGHVYIMKGDVKADSSSVLLNSQNNGNHLNIAHSGSGNWETLSGFLSKTGMVSDVNTVILLKDNRTSGWTASQMKNIQFFDLTVMFGSVIADTLYAMGDAGVEWFRKYFPKDYYAYDAGSLQSVQAKEHRTTGFNQWDEILEEGRLDTSTGLNFNTTGQLRAKNFIKVYPGREYYIHTPDSIGSIWTAFYKKDKTIISDGLPNGTSSSANCRYFTNGSIVKMPLDCEYIRFYLTSGYGIVYKNDICINVSGSKNGTYEPYKIPHTYPLDSSLALRGIPKWDSVGGKMYYDGDKYKSNGKVTRKYGYVDLGSLNWSYSTNASRFYINITSLNLNAKTPINAYVTIQGICAKLAIETWNNVTSNNYDNTIAFSVDGTEINVRCTSYTDAATFQTAMSGVYLVYELATPVEEDAAPFGEYQIVSAGGTEEFIPFGDQDVQIPVGHYTEYLEEVSGIKTVLNDQAYKLLSAGMLISDQYTEDKVPYNFRKSFDAEFCEEEIVGGTVAWNQIVYNGNFDSTSGWSPETYATLTVSDHIATMTNTNASNGIYNILNFIPAGHKIYWSLNVKKVETDGHLNLNILGVAISNVSVSTSWQKLSGVVNLTNQSTRFGIYPKEVNSEYNIKKIMAVDLTAMFGSTIADAIYAMEQATPGSGATWFRNMFPNEYYERDLGSLQSVQALAHKTTGFNQWDEQWENGYYNSSDVFVASNNYVCSKNLIPIDNSKIYYLKFPVAMSILLYDANKERIGTVVGTWQNEQIGPYNFGNARYIRFYSAAQGSLTTYNHDICINISNASKNGTYEPYVEHTYPLDPDLVLRGIPKWDSVGGKMYYDGDKYGADGKVTRRYGIVDLGSLSYSYNSVVQTMVSTGLNSLAKFTGNANVAGNLICAKYETQSLTIVNAVDKKIGIGGSSGLSIHDSDYTDAAAFKTAMSGVYLVYELATPTTEQADPFPEVMLLSPYGTEEYVDEREVAVPVGHNSKYRKDFRREMREAIADLQALILEN